MSHHRTTECRPETCGGVDYDPCPEAAAFERGARGHEHAWVGDLTNGHLCRTCRAKTSPHAGAAESIETRSPAVTTCGSCGRGLTEGRGYTGDAAYCRACARSVYGGDYRSDFPSAERETYTRADLARAFSDGVTAQREATRAIGGSVGRIVAANPYDEQASL